LPHREYLAILGLRIDLSRKLLQSVTARRRTPYAPVNRRGVRRRSAR